MNIHRASGTAIKRGRGRPKGSKSKRVVLIQGDQISDETAESQSRYMCTKFCFCNKLKIRDCLRYVIK